MYNALDLSKYIVSKCIDDEKPISNLQLQKILFYIQKEFLKKYNQPAFSDVIEAWQFGPVVPNVYYHFCGFGAMKIARNFESFAISNIRDKDLIDKIVDDKRELYPWDLVAETHKPNGAWDKVYQNGIGNHNPIPTNLIKEEN